MPIEGKTLAVACARAADNIKAGNIRVLDVRGISAITDYMVVCSGSSTPQLRAILREISERIDEEYGEKPVHSEGKADTRWIVIDFIDVMVHVMEEELREFYALEDLWKDADEVSWEEQPA